MMFRAVESWAHNLLEVEDWRDEREREREAGRLKHRHRMTTADVLTMVKKKPVHLETVPKPHKIM